jgi:phosphatidylglycerophosphate synthase
MARASLSAADWVSLSRVGLAFIFVGTFRNAPGALLAASIAVAVLAQLSDHLDGYLARRASLAGLRGWLFDSIGDRAFYIAALLAFDREYDLGEVLVWLFVLRELALYAFRLAVGDFETRRRGFRVLALGHAALVRIGIALGCILPLGILPRAVGACGVPALQTLFLLATLFGFGCLGLLITGKSG